MLKINYHMVLKKCDWNYRPLLNILLLITLVNKKIKISPIDHKTSSRFMLLRSPFHYKYSKSIIEDTNSYLIFSLYLENSTRSTTKLYKDRFSLYSGFFLSKISYSRSIFF